MARKNLHEMKLYELPDEIHELEDLLDQRQELAIDSPEYAMLSEEISSRFKALVAHRDAKTQALANYLRTLKAQQVAIEDQYRFFEKKYKSKKQRVESVMAYMQRCMEALGLDSLEGLDYKFKICNNGGSLPIRFIGEDLNLIPEEFRKIRDIEFDSDKVRAWIEEHEGEIPEGFELAERGKHLRFS
jgi:hypothetical protein